jgi:hypothetical protein
MRSEERTRLTFRLCIKLDFCEIASDIGKMTVWLITIWVETGQQFLDSERPERSIDGDNGWTIFLHASQIPLSALLAIEFRIGALHSFGFDRCHRIDAAAQKARQARLQIMDRSRDTRDASVPIGIQTNSYIDVGHAVKGCNPIENVA